MMVSSCAVVAVDVAMMINPPMSRCLIARDMIVLGIVMSGGVSMTKLAALADGDTLARHTCQLVSGWFMIFACEQAAFCPS